MYRILLGAADGHLHQGGSKEPVMQEIAFLQDRHYRLRRNRRIFFADDSLVDLWIEGYACLLDGPETVLLQRVVQLFVNHEDAAVEVVPLLGMLERTIEVVEHGQQVLHHAGEGVFEEILLLTLRALAE